VTLRAAPRRLAVEQQGLSIQLATFGYLARLFADTLRQLFPPPSPAPHDAAPPSRQGLAWRLSRVLDALRRMVAVGRACAAGCGTSLSAWAACPLHVSLQEARKRVFG
jgi:hypothetical protein